MTEIPEHLLKRAQDARDNNPPDPKRVVGRRIVSSGSPNYLQSPDQRARERLHRPPAPPRNRRGPEPKDAPEQSFFQYFMYTSNGRKTAFGEFITLLAIVFTRVLGLVVLGLVVLVMTTDPNLFTFSLFMKTAFGVFITLLTIMFSWVLSLVVLGLVVVMMSTDPNLFTFSLFFLWVFGHSLGVAVWHQNRKYNRKYKR